MAREAMREGRSRLAYVKVLPWLGVPNGTTPVDRVCKRATPVMSATLVEIALGTVAGIVGGIAAAGATKEHSRGVWIDVIAGGAGGIFGTIFLRNQVLLIVNEGGGRQAAGDPMVQTGFLAFAAAGEGAIVALAAALMMMWLAEHKSK